MQLFIGVMSGTSLDGIDAALCAFEGADCQLLGTHFLPYPDTLKTELLALHEPTANELETATLMGNKLAVLYADAVNALLKSTQKKASNITAIGCHGQTIRHCPNFSPELGFTLQIGNAALLAERTDISVVSDFRSRDIAAGGQGAPLVPAFHQAIFGSNQVNRALINIGGIANITYLGKNGTGLNSGKVLGFDSGPGNMLLDSWTKLKIGQAYDADGAWAATGMVHESLLFNMLAEPYFALPPPKSTGRDLFNDAWLKQHQLYPHLRPQDVARTLVALTAQSIVDALEKCGAVDEVYLCGGGAHNSLLAGELQKLLGDKKVLKTNHLGIDVDWVEAVAFAWLAKQTIENKPGNLPAVTGAKGLRVLGNIYPK
jgi:anhydro-N-acetylmuramic acid kinase